jgi:hypothetical protein
MKTYIAEGISILEHQIISPNKNTLKLIKEENKKCYE